MKFTAQLDVSVVAHETADEVVVLLDLEAPDLTPDADRAPAIFQVVLDRSGSMSDLLPAAVEALERLVDRLDARDSFGVVVFDDQAQVAVPAGPVDDKDRIVAQLRSIQPGGMTDLGAGLLRGLQEVRRVSKAEGTTGATLLLVSDGHTNCGVTDQARLASVASHGRAMGVVTSTLGLGLGYDESLLEALARSGAGNHVFAAGADQAGAAIAAEATGLLSKTVQAASLTVRFSEDVRMLRVYNDLPGHQVAPDAVMLEIGDLYAGEKRKLLLKLEVPAMAALGLKQVASLELGYVELPDMVGQTVLLPLTVNVVPGDQAAGRVADPVVRTEVLFQEAQDDKKLASEALERGDREQARRHLGAARSKLEQAGEAAPDALLADVQVELDDVRCFGAGIDTHAPAMMSKMTRESFYEARYKRGRRRSGDEG